MTILAWGSDAELLTADTSLKLHQTDTENRLIWHRSVPNAVKLAQFSLDSSLLATTGYHDRLIKLWRRQAFGADDTRFSFTYLSHPQTVTSLQFRNSLRHERHVDNVLFSICADKKIRIWAVQDPHGVQALQFWAELDVQESIQPRSAVSSASSERYAFFIDSTDFGIATAHVNGRLSAKGKQDDHALEHFLEVGKTSSEICVIIDRAGYMSAWGLDNIGHHEKKATDIFNIAHVDDFRIPFRVHLESEEEVTQFLSFPSANPNYPFVLLVHFFDGRIEWLESRLEHLLDPSPNSKRFRTVSSWTGHDTTVQNLTRSSNGSALLSTTLKDEAILWKPELSIGGSSVMIRANVIQLKRQILKSIVLREGRFVLTLHHGSVFLWSTAAFASTAVRSVKCQFEGDPLCFIQLSSKMINLDSMLYVAIITSKMESIVFSIDFHPVSQDDDSRGVETGQNVQLREFCRASFDELEELSYLAAVDPAGSRADSRDDLLSCSSNGTLMTWTALVDDKDATVSWRTSSVIETKVAQASLTSSTTLGKIALVDASRCSLTIWDQIGTEMEHLASFDKHDEVQHLKWYTTPDQQSILLVGFPHKLILLAQLRYDYLHKGPAWAPIREIQIRELNTHPIGDSAWLSNGDIMVAAGNQLYVFDSYIKSADPAIIDAQIGVHASEKQTIFDLISYLNGILPVFHPQFVGQSILAGKLGQVDRILLRLNKVLKYHLNGDHMSHFLDMPLREIYMTDLVSLVRNEIWTTTHASSRRAKQKKTRVTSCPPMA